MFRGDDYFSQLTREFHTCEKHFSTYLQYMVVLRPCRIRIQLSEAKQDLTAINFVIFWLFYPHSSDMEQEGAFRIITCTIWSTSRAHGNEPRKAGISDERL